MENVDAILNQGNIAEFRRWIMFLDKLGYCSSYKVLNAKDYGVPQNRKRCFMVSTRTLGQFVFPEGRPLDKRLKDILEDNVPESYYLTDERIAKYERHNVTQHAQERGLEVAGDLHLEGRFDVANRVHDPNGISPTIHCGVGGGTMPKIEIVGEINDSKFNGSRRVLSVNGIAPTITTEHPGPNTPKIEVTGKLGKTTQHYTVYGTGGISPTIAACDFKDPTKIEIEEREQ